MESTRDILLLALVSNKAEIVVSKQPHSSHLLPWIEKVPGLYADEEEVGWLLQFSMIFQGNAFWNGFLLPSKKEQKLEKIVDTSVQPGSDKITCFLVVDHLRDSPKLSEDFEWTSWERFCELVLANMNLSATLKLQLLRKFNVNEADIKFDPQEEENKFSNNEDEKISGERIEWKAAGILPKRKGSGDQFEYLLGRNHRGKLQVLGGKKEFGESEKETAVREFIEETSSKPRLGLGIVKSFEYKRKLTDILNQGETSRRRWIPDGKYYLFELDVTNPTNEVLKRMHNAQLAFENDEIRSLRWVRAPFKEEECDEFLVKICQSIGIQVSERRRSIVVSNRPKLYFPEDEAFARRLQLDEKNAAENNRYHPVDEEIAWNMHMEKKEVEKKQVALQKNLQRELDQLDRELKDLESQDVEKMIYKPPPLFEKLDSHHPEYKQATAGMQGNPTCVRKVNVPARMMEIAKFSSSAHCKRIRSWHGTPKVENGTSIALYGFKEELIGTHGVACGRGVYSTTAWGTCFSYCGASGCVVVLDAFVQNGDYDSGSIFVTRDVHRSVPRYILDFGPPDNSAQEASLSEEVIELLKKRQGRLKRGCILYQDFLTNLLQSTTVFKTPEHIDELHSSLMSEKAIRKLPIYLYREELVPFLIGFNKICLIQAGTGVGKSTVIPQLLVDKAFQKNVLVLVPTRELARSLATYVAFSRGEELGDSVIYLVGRGASPCKFDPFKHKIVFATYGYCYQIVTSSTELADDDKPDFLDQFSCIVLDEIHVRSVESDLICGFLKHTVETSGLKLVVMSATVQSEEFQKFFNIRLSDIFKIDSLEFPVNVNYEEDPLERDEVQKVSSVALNLVKLTQEGNILAFVSGVKEVSEVVKCIETMLPEDDEKTGQFEVLPLYANMSEKEKKNVCSWEPPLNCPKTRLIVVSTNIAETGITLPNICYVIDNGFERRMVYEEKYEIYSLERVRISQASAQQRRGRAGRVGPGNCIRLYGEKVFEEMAKHSDPCIEFIPMEKYLLDIISQGYYPDFFPWVTRLSNKKLDMTRQKLSRVGAIEEESKDWTLTDLGTLMQKIPVFGIRQKKLIALAIQEAPEELATAIDLAVISSFVPYYKWYSLLGDQKSFESDHFAVRDLLERSGFLAHGISSILEDVEAEVERITPIVQSLSNVMIKPSYGKRVSKTMLKLFLKANSENIAVTIDDTGNRLMISRSISSIDPKLLPPIEANLHSMILNQKWKRGTVVIFEELSCYKKKDDAGNIVSEKLICNFLTAFPSSIVSDAFRGDYVMQGVLEDTKELSESLRVRSFEEMTLQERVDELLNPQSDSDKIVFKTSLLKLYWVVGKELLQQGCSIYGGYIRDFLVNGEAPQDIDAQSFVSKDETCNKLLSSPHNPGLKLQHSGNGGNPYLHELIATSSSTGGQRVTVQIVDPNAFKRTSKPDLDVNNLEVSLRRNNLGFKHMVNLKIEEVLSNIRNKIFRVIGDHKIPERKQKLLSRNWKETV